MTPSASSQRGQAMVEFVIISGVLIALFLGIWYIGKYHDIQAAAIQAARYAAWERTAHPASFSDALLQNQARARLFQWDRNALTAADGVSGNAWSTQTAMWRSHDNRESLVKQPGDVTISTASGALPGRAANLISNLLGAVTAAVGVVSGGQALNQGGFYTSQVTVNIAKVSSLPAPLNQLNLSLHESSALATDSWDASGPEQVALRTRDFTPSSIFDRIQPILTPVDYFLSLLEPAFSQFKPGQICPDIVPADRLDPGVSKLPRYDGGGPCY